MKGYVDQKDELWWLKFVILWDLVEILIIFIWVVLGYYVVVNFGQYDYVGFVFNRLCLVWWLILEII